MSFKLKKLVSTITIIFYKSPAAVLAKVKLWGSQMVEPRLAWRCRRGMLELDLALAAFLAKGYDVLTPTQQQHFNELLDEADPLLFEWIILRKPCEDPRFSELLTIIHHHVALH